MTSVFYREQAPMTVYNDRDLTTRIPKMKRLALAASAAALLSACAGGNMMSYSQASLPDSVKVPAGNKVALETVGSGSITYECRVKANVAGQFEDSVAAVIDWQVRFEIFWYLELRAMDMRSESV